MICLKKKAEKPHFEKYEDALKILEGREKLKLSTKDNEKIIEILNTNVLNGCESKNISSAIYESTQFLSALHNTISNKTIVVDSFLSEFPKIEATVFYAYLGCNLKPEKILVVGKNLKNQRSLLYHLGFYSEGTIINYGDVDHLATECKKGTYLNFGKSDLIGTWSYGGVKINYETTTSLSRKHHGGTYINKGKETTIVLGGPEPWCIEIKNNMMHHRNFEKENNFSKASIMYGNNFILCDKDSIIDLSNNYDPDQKLNEKLKQIEALKDLKDAAPEQIIKKVESINLSKLEKEITEIADEIKEYHIKQNKK